MKKINIISYAVLSIAVVMGGVFMYTSRPVSAADRTVNPGESIQAAINAAAAGDTIIVNAGTYDETLSVTKPLTLRGAGAVTVRTKSTTPTANKGIDIQNTQNVTIENITFDGENGDPTKQTGVDINSVQNITLRNVTVKNYAKNGVAVTTQHDPSYVEGGNVMLENVTVDTAAWAGIAFYTRSGVGHDVPLTGVQFAGTTTVGNTAYGIQFGDRKSDLPITGVSDGPVALGVVRFYANTTANLSNDEGQVTVTISSESTVATGVDSTRPIEQGDLGVFASATIIAPNSDTGSGQGSSSSTDDKKTGVDDKKTGVTVPKVPDTSK